MFIPKVTVYGVKQVNFTGKDGNVVDGVRFFVGYDDSKVDGVITDSFFLSRDKLDGVDVKVGDDIEVLYNKYGKAAAIRPVK